MLKQSVFQKEQFESSHAMPSFYNNLGGVVFSSSNDLNGTSNINIDVVEDEKVIIGEDEEEEDEDEDEDEDEEDEYEDDYVEEDINDIDENKEKDEDEEKDEYTEREREEREREREEREREEEELLKIIKLELNKEEDNEEDKDNITIHKVNESIPLEDEGEPFNPINNDREYYRKLSTQQLKTIVITKGLSTDVQKLKKNDLLKILENTDV